MNKYMTKKHQVNYERVIVDVCRVVLIITYIVSDNSFFATGRIASTVLCCLVPPHDSHFESTADGE